MKQATQQHDINVAATIDGYMKDSQGRLWPESKVKPIDKERDQLVHELIKNAIAVNTALAHFKKSAFGDIAAFVELSAEQYDAKLGGKKGNVTLFSFDGQYKVQFAVAENIQFDERLQAAKSLIDECIKEWSQGSSPEIQVLVQDAFKTDKEGNLNHGRILALRRLEIKDQRWKNAMTAIGESVQVIGSKQYIRFYERRAETDQYDPIPLDMAAI
ncbi:DUF3164 family protein [Undibacterium sp.]|uniref:DUF3164 family protein n=1 Tax=Undibacterium sp. TaxID=1914977 RepID=UPI002730476A|nr:DUF3164 family protein [Undibacterium sp.]MDP1980500.1 DUF3164 family protein [Undibacterium sp.]